MISVVACLQDVLKLDNDDDDDDDYVNVIYYSD